jgi:hypothetical protein
VLNGKNLAACILAIKGQLGGQTSAFFSFDALHREKNGLVCPKTTCFSGSKPLAKFLR